MKSILGSEFKLLCRNMLVLVSVAFMPIIFCVGLFFLKEAFPGGLVGSAALMVFSICTIGLYVTATTTLAERRQNFYLKKLLCTSASPLTIISAILLPIIIVVLTQLFIVLGLLSYLAEPPQHLFLLIAGIIFTVVLMVMAAFFTAARTKSAAHAQTTTMPLFCIFFGACVWATSFPNPNLETFQLALPGGAAALLIQKSWVSISLGEGLLLAVITVAWAGFFLFLSIRTFQWEPNR